MNFRNESICLILTNNCAGHGRCLENEPDQFSCTCVQLYIPPHCNVSLMDDDAGVNYYTGVYIFGIILGLIALIGLIIDNILACKKKRFKLNYICFAQLFLMFACPVHITVKIVLIYYVRNAKTFTYAQFLQFEVLLRVLNQILTFFLLFCYCMLLYVWVRLSSTSFEINSDNEKLKRIKISIISLLGIFMGSMIILLILYGFDVGFHVVRHLTNAILGVFAVIFLIWSTQRSIYVLRQLKHMKSSKMSVMKRKSIIYLITNGIGLFNLITFSLTLAIRARPVTFFFELALGLLFIFFFLVVENFLVKNILKSSEATSSKASTVSTVSQLSRNQ